MHCHAWTLRDDAVHAITARGHAVRASRMDAWAGRDDRRGLQGTRSSDVASRTGLRQAALCRRHTQPRLATFAQQLSLKRVHGPRRRRRTRQPRPGGAGTHRLPLSHSQPPASARIADVLGMRAERSLTLPDSLRLRQVGHKLGTVPSGAGYSAHEVVSAEASGAESLREELCTNLQPTHSRAAGPIPPTPRAASSCSERQTGSTLNGAAATKTGRDLYVLAWVAPDKTASGIGHAHALCGVIASDLAGSSM